MSYDPIKEYAKILSDQKWRIDFNPTTYEVQILNDDNEKLPLDVYGLLIKQLEVKAAKFLEAKIGEQRKAPLDEFTQKRLGIDDYVLIDNSLHENHNKIIEAYHDINGFFALEGFTVHTVDQYKHECNEFYFNHVQAKKLLPAIVNFVKKYEN